MPSVRCLRQPSANCRALPRSVGAATRHTQNQIIVRYSGVLYKARYAVGAPCFGACSPARSSPSLAPSRGAPLSCGSFVALFRFAACARHSPRFGCARSSHTLRASVPPFILWRAAATSRRPLGAPMRVSLAGFSGRALVPRAPVRCARWAQPPARHF